MRNAMPSTFAFTTSVFRLIICVRLSLGSGISIPCSLKCSFAFMKCSDESSSALDGIHPTLRQVPPRVLYFSTIAVLNPNCAHRIAATYPPGPEPITVTLYCMIKFFVQDKLLKKSPLGLKGDQKIKLQGSIFLDPPAFPLHVQGS